MFKRLLGLAALAGTAAAAVKVVTDILKADEEEKQLEVVTVTPEAEEAQEETVTEE